MANNPFITAAPQAQTMVDPEAQALQRQKQYAAMLMQQNQQPQGQMIGNRFVAPSWTQQLNAALNPVVGAYMMNKADTEQEKLAQRLRKETAEGLMEYNKLRYGSPEQVTYGAGEEGPTKQVTPGLEANPQAAYDFALSNKSPTVYNMAMEMLKPQKLAEGEKIVTYNPMTGKEQVVMQGGEKYHAPIAVDTGTKTVLLDPKTMKPVAEYGKSTAGHVYESDNGPVLIDTRTNKATPIMMNGQPLTGGKPLTESQSNATAFGMRAAKTNDLLKELENSGTTTPGGIKTFVKGTLGSVPLVGESLADAGGALTNWTASNAQQATDQARRNFITAVLRKESGASISPTEFANEERKYFPQIGDSQETIKQKQDARDLAVKALEIQAGPGAKQIQTIKSNVPTPTINADSAAKSWLKANPTHPLAKQIEAKLKAEGKL